MTTNPTPSAKELVLQFVREKNPQTMELKFGCEIMITGCEYIFDFICEENNKYILKTQDDSYAIIRKPFSTKILGSDMGLQELLNALCLLGAHSIIGDWKTHGTINGILAFYSGDGDALFKYDLTQNLHNQPDEFYTSLLPLIND